MSIEYFPHLTIRRRKKGGVLLSYMRLLRDFVPRNDKLADTFATK